MLGDAPDRFSAYLVVKRNLRQKSSRQQARRAEAAMEALAVRLERDVESWAAMALLSQADLDFADSNLHARGRVAREIAEADGLSAALTVALERFRGGPDEGETVEGVELWDALFLAETIAELTGDAEPDWEDIDERLLMRTQRIGDDGDRMRDALARLAVDASLLPVLAREVFELLGRGP